MAKQVISRGTGPNTGTGDSPYTAVGYINDNFTELYNDRDTQLALNPTLAPKANPVFTGTVQGVTATMVGLGNVNNTADAAKPVSTAQNTAIVAGDIQRLSTKDAYTDFVASGLATPVPTNTLTGVLSVGVAYVDGKRTERVVTSSFAYQFSSDTYVDIDSAGTLTRTPVALNAAEPVLAAGALRLEKVTTDGTKIISVTSIAARNTIGAPVTRKNTDQLFKVSDGEKDFVLSGLSTPVPTSSSTGTMSAGNGYVNGIRVEKFTSSTFVYAVSSDTYNDIDSNGNITQVVVANGAVPAAVAAGKVRLEKVVTNATPIITSVVRLAPDRSTVLAVRNSLKGASRLVASSGIQYAIEVTPATDDYPGIMNARMECIKAGGGVVRLGNGPYEIGSAYLPLTSGVLYKGNQPTFRFLNGEWTDRDNIIVGGTVIRGDGTQIAAFWDGVSDLTAPQPIVAATNATFTAGSTSIAVADSANFPVGAQVYFTSTGYGVYEGHMYFVLTSGANVITVGMAERIAIIATSSGVLQISAGFPNAATVGGGVENMVFSNIRTAVKSGANETVGSIYCKYHRLYVDGLTGYRCFDFLNFIHTTFHYMWSRYGDGHYYGANVLSSAPLDIQPGNCEFTDLYNINDRQTARGLRFEALGTNTQLNELHIRMIQNNNKGGVAVTQATSGMAANSPDITVTDGSLFPVDMPVWVSTVSNPNGFSTNLIYFVVSRVGNVIQLSTTYRGAAKNSTGSAAMNLTHKGFPGIEVVSTPGNRVQNWSMTGVDVEGPSTCGILLQNSIGNMTIHQFGDDMQASVCARGTSAGTINSTEANFNTDFDATSALNMLLFGQRRNSVVLANAGVGMTYDKGLAAWVLNLNPYAAQLYPSMKGISGPNGAFTQPGLPMAQVMLTNDATQTMGNGTGGWNSFNGPASQIKTLPTISNATAASTLIGYPINFSNASANTLVINTDGTQLFNNQATKTSCSLAPGQWLECIAAKTLGGTFYWIAKTNGTI